MTRTIGLSSKDNCYKIEGNSLVVVFKNKGDIIIETPELGFGAGLDGQSVRGFSLDEKTRELSVEFIRGGCKLERIDIGIVEDYDSALEWVRVVNELYRRRD